MKITRRQFLKSVSIGGAAALVASYPVVIERFTVLVNTYSIPLTDLPSAFEGFTIVHLSDLHYGRLMPLGILKSVIQRANSIPRDMIACTGDYVTAMRQMDAQCVGWKELTVFVVPDGRAVALWKIERHWHQTQLRFLCHDTV